MDTTTANRSGEQVQQDLLTIRTRMPKLYEAIKERAKVQPEVYALVRRGLRGEVNCFYAMEAGHVMGAPFAGERWAKVADVLREQALQFGFGFVVMWGDAQPSNASVHTNALEGAAHGTH
jgi:hypothetical protein